VKSTDGFTRISTEELENLIGDRLLDDDADVDILYQLLEAYDKREGLADIDVSAAWERFNSDYSGKGETYLIEDAEKPEQTNSIRSTRPKPRGRSRPLRRVFIVAAAIIFLAGTLSAYAIGGVSWQSAVQRTLETFGFVRDAAPVEINEGLIPLHNTLEEHGITARLAPTWTPDGFTLSGYNVFETLTSSIFIFLFENGEMELIIQIISHSEFISGIYEVTGDEISTYARNGIEHHIMMNDGKVKVVWENINYECSISGDITVNDAERIINSIYER
jgi:hypothetical protein